MTTTPSGKPRPRTAPRPAKPTRTNRPANARGPSRATAPVGRSRPAPRPRTAAQPADAAVPGYGFADVTSGLLDAQTAVPVDDAATGAAQAAPLPSPKRVLQPEAAAPKLHKMLAQAGLGSRLEMERLIREGRITVNDAPAHIGQRVLEGDIVRLDGQPVKVRIAPPTLRVLAYHKPAGEVVTHDDPQNRPTVFRKLPRLLHGKWQSVGRLDLNTEGLLLLTSSGTLANQLMHPRFGLEREYAVRVLGALDKEEKQRLLHGVELEDGPAAFTSLEDGGGEGANVWYRVTITEGRNREVRRMFEAVGRAVSRLIRIRYGAVQLPRGLRRGAWVELDAHDVRALVQACGADAALLERPASAGSRSFGERRQADRASSRARARTNARIHASSDTRGNPHSDARIATRPNDRTPPRPPGGAATPRRTAFQREAAASPPHPAAARDGRLGKVARTNRPSAGQSPAAAAPIYIGQDSLERARMAARRGPGRGGGRR